MSDIVALIAKESKAAKSAESAAKESKSMPREMLLRKARVGAAQKILKAIKDEDADMLIFALDDLAEISADDGDMDDDSSSN